MSVLIWAAAAPGTREMSPGVEVSDRGSASGWLQEEKQRVSGKAGESRRWPVPECRARVWEQGGWGRLWRTLKTRQRSQRLLRAAEATEFVFLFLMVTPLSICFKLYAKGISVATACGMDARWLEIRTRVLSGPRV